MLGVYRDATVGHCAKLQHMHKGGTGITSSDCLQFMDSSSSATLQMFHCLMSTLQSSVINFDFIRKVLRFKER
jgi:hypothetical protein